MVDNRNRRWAAAVIIPGQALAVTGYQRARKERTRVGTGYEASQRASESHDLRSIGQGPRSRIDSVQGRKKNIAGVTVSNTRGERRL